MEAKIVFSELIAASPEDLEELRGLLAEAEQRGGLPPAVRAFLKKPLEQQGRSLILTRTGLGGPRS